MDAVLRSWGTGGALFGLGLVLTGCGSAASQMVKPEAMKPVAPLELQMAAGGGEFTLTGLIAYDGPGAWKKHAYWDEYQVKFVNHGAESVELTALTLGDVLGREITAGNDPWVLEKAGQEQLAFLKSQKIDLSPGKIALVPQSPPKPVVYTAGSVIAGTAVSAGAVSLFYLPAAGVAVGGLIFAAPVAIAVYSPAFLINKWSVDPKNRALVLAEFDRRRLKLPATIGPGAMVAGSVFFPLTPGPERLVLHGRRGAEAVEAAVVLLGLDGLHFPYFPDKATLKAVKPKPGTFDFMRSIPERTTPPPAADRAKDSDQGAAVSAAFRA